MGKRLAKLTKNSPKTLLHINGKSMIQQIIEKLSNNAYESKTKNSQKFLKDFFFKTSEKNLRKFNY